MASKAAEQLDEIIRRHRDGVLEEAAKACEGHMRAAAAANIFGRLSEAYSCAAVTLRQMKSQQAQDEERAKRINPQQVAPQPLSREIREGSARLERG